MLEQLEIAHSDGSPEAIGQRLRRSHALTGSRLKRPVRVIRSGRLRSDDLALLRDRPDRESGSANEAASPDRGRDHVELRLIAQKLERRGSLTRNHAGVIEGMNEVSRSALDQLRQRG